MGKQLSSIKFMHFTANQMLKTEEDLSQLSQTCLSLFWSGMMNMADDRIKRKDGRGTQSHLFVETCVPRGMFLSFMLCL